MRGFNRKIILIPNRSASQSSPFHQLRQLERSEQTRAYNLLEGWRVAITVETNDGPLTGERVQKRIAHWDKQNNDVPGPNCVLKVREEIIKVEGL